MQIGDIVPVADIPDGAKFKFGPTTAVITKTQDTCQGIHNDMGNFYAEVIELPKKTYTIDQYTLDDLESVRDILKKYPGSKEVVLCAVDELDDLVNSLNKE
jgi:hypothetical protein